MLQPLLSLIPAEALQVALVIFLCALLGLEREEHKTQVAHYSFGGIRTFPLLGLVGYVLTLMASGQMVVPAIGFVVVGAFMLVSYRHKLSKTEAAGVTTEVSGLLTYLLGGLVALGHYWMAATIAILAMMMLELKDALESMTRRVAPEEIVAFGKFLLLTVVILPLVPNQSFTPFQINPFKTWLIVVAVSAVSYGSYLLQRFFGGRGGVLLGGFLGGAYSSTATTIALSRRAKDGSGAPHMYAGAILVASGVMYARIALLVFFVDRALGSWIVPAFGALALVGCGAGVLFSQRPGEKSAGASAPALAGKNPLALAPAFLFAAIFVAVLIATRLAEQHLGHAGIYVLAAVIGIADVDPFVLGVAQSAALASAATPLPVAATAVAIAAASNNVAKGVYALAFAGRGSKTGRWSLALLLGLAAAGLVPIAFFL